MKQWLGYSLLGLTAYAVFMILQFPAGMLMSTLAPYLPHLSVLEARGSAISGTARGLRVGNRDFGQVAWQLRPLALLTGRVAFYLTAQEAQMNLQGVASMGLSRRLELSDLKGRLALSRACALLDDGPAPPVDGELELDLAELGLGEDGHPHAAQGRLRLLGARITIGKPLELGNFSATLTTKDQTILGSVKDDGGPLEFSGNLTLAQDGGYRLNGEAAVRDQGNRDLSQALSVLGPSGSDGKWKVDFAGTL